MGGSPLANQSQQLSLSAPEQPATANRWLDAPNFADYEPWAGDVWWWWTPAKLIIQPGKLPVILVAGDIDDLEAGQPELAETEDSIPVPSEPDPVLETVSEPEEDNRLEAAAGLWFMAGALTVAIAYVIALLGGYRP